MRTTIGEGNGPIKFSRERQSSILGGASAIERLRFSALFPRWSDIYVFFVVSELLGGLLWGLKDKTIRATRSSTRNVLRQLIGEGRHECGRLYAHVHTLWRPRETISLGGFAA